MEPRYLSPGIAQLCFASHKMALISGPRQCGKTTLAKLLLSQRGGGLYGNWDDPAFRRAWTRDPVAWAGDVPLIVLDEIHKARGWKRTLKGVYDTREQTGDVIVTGSARLNVYKKGGDSLLGRAFHFRMHPFSAAELEQPATPNTPEATLAALAARSPRFALERQQRFDRLLRFGGFPEPFLRASDVFARVWRRSRTEKIIREDVRDLSRIPELSRIEMLASLLPERVASPLSLTALREDLEVSLDTVRRWVAMLSELYYLRLVRPWTKRVARSLQKEAKLYLWDWSEVEAEGPRFENMVALHLLKACDYWSDVGHGEFALHSLRNKEKEEIDFLVTRKAKPWLLVEAKLTDTAPSAHFRKFMRYMPGTPALQIVRVKDSWAHHRVGDGEVLVASGAEALACFV
jgi:uncharacterized protein